MRSFALASTLGAISAHLSQLISAWFLPLGFLAFASAVIVSYVITASRDVTLGMTTEMSLFLSFGIGALCFLGQTAIAVALAVVITIILSLKPTVRVLREEITQEDIRATLKFALIAFVIFPFLPDRAYDPYGILNPRYIWLMVVLVSSVSFAGYAAMKIFGARRGVGLTGLFGGLASSTAVSIALAERSRSKPGLVPHFSWALVIASTIMFPRIAVLVSAVMARLVPLLALPLGVMTVVGVLVAVYQRRSLDRSSDVDRIDITNPFNLAPAFKFGLIYIAVMAVVKICYHYLGNGGIYIAAILSGISGVDKLSEIAFVSAEYTGNKATFVIDKNKTLENIR